jgi:hypothetical protein
MANEKKKAGAATGFAALLASIGALLKGGGHVAEESSGLLRRAVQTGEHVVAPAAAEGHLVRRAVQVGEREVSHLPRPPAMIRALPHPAAEPPPRMPTLKPSVYAQRSAPLAAEAAQVLGSAALKTTSASTGQRLLRLQSKVPPSRAGLTTEPAGVRRRPGSRGVGAACLGRAGFQPGSDLRVSPRIRLNSSRICRFS